MSTTSQTDANRRNAKKSTGPRSAEGKAASSQNALNTGIDARSLIIRGESLSDLEALAARYHDRFQPATPEQSLLVDAMISADWLLRRLRKVEPQIWEREFKDAKTYSRYNRNILLGDAFGHANHEFNRLQRRLDSMERSYHRALESLRTLRPDFFEPPPPPPAAPPEPVTPLPPTEIGFVPSTKPNSDPRPDECQPAAQSAAHKEPNPAPPAPAASATGPAGPDDVDVEVGSRSVTDSAPATVGAKSAEFLPELSRTLRSSPGSPLPQRTQILTLFFSAFSSTISVSPRSGRVVPGSRASGLGRGRPDC